MTDIDWNAELRKIEREYDGLPPEKSTAELRAKREIEQRMRERQKRDAAAVVSAGLLVLVAGLALSFRWWPYAHDCGPGLWGFVAAQGMVAVGGAQVAMLSWRHRIASSHVAALVLVLTGLVFVAAQVLPRAGVAMIRGVEATPWRCAAPDVR